MVVARVSSSGICESMRQAGSGVGDGAPGGGPRRCARSTAGCAAPLWRSRPRESARGVDGVDPIPHFGEAFVRQAFPGGQQATSVGPLRVDLAAAPVVERPGHPAAHRGQRVVGQRGHMEVVDDELGVGQQPGRADRRGVGSGGVDGHRTGCSPGTAVCALAAMPAPPRRRGLHAAP